MHLLKALERYEVQLVANGRSPYTICSIRRYVGQLAAWLAAEKRSLRIERLTSDDIADFLASDAGRCCPDGRLRKATSTNVLRSVLKSFFRAQHAAGNSPRNAAALVRRARCAPGPPRGLSPREEQALRDELAKAKTPEERRDEALFLVLLETGIRIGSALALHRDDVDLEQRLLWLRTTKGNRPERVVLSKMICRHLTHYEPAGPGPYLFPGRFEGRPLADRHVRRQLDLWLGRAGVKRHVTVHGLRHSYAARLMARSGGDLLLVQQAMRHRSITSTLSYVGPPADRLAELLDRPLG